LLYKINFLGARFMIAINIWDKRILNLQKIVE